MSEQQSSSQTDRKREVRMGGGRHGVLRIEKAKEIRSTAVADVYQTTPEYPRYHFPEFHVNIRLSSFF